MCFFLKGSTITEQDLKNYSVEWDFSPIKSHLKQLDLDLVTPTSPSGGPVLQMAMLLIDSKHIFKTQTISTVLQVILESNLNNFRVSMEKH